MFKDSQDKRLTDNHEVLKSFCQPHFRIFAVDLFSRSVEKFKCENAKNLENERSICCLFDINLRKEINLLKKKLGNGVLSENIVIKENHEKMFKWKFATVY